MCHYNLVINISLSHQPVKLLGFPKDNKLNWECHIDKIVKIFQIYIYISESQATFVSHDLKKTTYFGLFQFHVSCGLLPWGFSSHVRDVLMLQQNFV